jgi:predicted Rossmann fold nucleotide-binding protein DprA/Smf involved in DNA uptake
MVVPGNPWFAHTAGSNRLLREGAIPVCSVADVHGVLGCPPPVSVGGVAERVLDALEVERHVVEISEGVSVPVHELLPCLMEMELANLVEKRPGNYYKKLSAPGR